ncbi:MAG: hypothetical protein WCD52_07660, partial [Xanthobacteraceae bacterium]
EPKSPEETADRFGIRTALLVLCVGLLSRPCGWSQGQASRSAARWKISPSATPAIDALRNNLFKPPAKGGDLRNG